MGAYDSSRTRVRPIFCALCLRDSSGRSWLPSLLQLTSIRRPLPSLEELGLLIQPPTFEMPADPPKELLAWFIRHPERLRHLQENEWNRWSAFTQRKRKALFAGDGATREEALAALEKEGSLPERAWWRFEGVTSVDCALLPPSTVVFVEGKRTEIGPARDVFWYPRHQVLRNLDCAAEYARKSGRRDFYVLLVVEGKLFETDPIRQAEIASTALPETLERSLPHLSAEDRVELLSHYLGFTTWEAIVDNFGLPTSLLN